MSKRNKPEFISFRTSSDVKALLDGIAEDDDRSLAYIVDKIIRESLEEKGLLNKEEK